MDSQRIYDIYLASRQSSLLVVSVHLGVFQLLEETPCSQDELGEALSLSKRGADALIIGLQALELVEKTPAGLLVLGEEASRFLIPGKPGYLGGLIELEMRQFLSPDRLLAALRSGKPGVYGEQSTGNAWNVHDNDADKAKAFTLGMHSISEMPASVLAEVIDFSVCHRLLDIGGGSGVFVIAALRRWAHLKGTVVDLEPVCRVAEEMYAQENLSERASTLVMDMFNEEFPSGYDVILFSQIMHDWSTPTNVELLAKAWRALPTGGKVLLHEKLLNKERKGPLANALVTLDMLYWTEGQQYSGEELEGLLDQSGFTSIRRFPTTGYWSVVVGEKG